MKKITAHIAKKEHKQINIDSDFIRLDSLLKLCNAVMTGGHAKIVIQESEVKVNGEIWNKTTYCVEEDGDFTFIADSDMKEQNIIEIEY